MILELIDSRITEKRDGVKISEDIYELWEYEVTHKITTYPDGDIWDRVHVDPATHTVPFLPFIERESDGREREFKIISEDYGNLTPDEADQLIEAYKMAAEACRILNINFT